jgi:hypothetical protein
LAAVTDENDATASATSDPAPAADPTPVPGPHRPTGSITPRPVQYKGEPLARERGPGLGCFRFQLVLLVILILVTPLSVGRVPDVVTAGLLFVTIALLLVSGQTIIFLLRLVAADRRGRRQPLAPRSPTVGQLEDGEQEPESAAEPESTSQDQPAPPDEPGPPGTGPVRQ